ncbi:MAG: cytochrome oxidase [Hyphomicrobiales bacterium]|nr:cytochrome oxidase [Hyphomicrobiales bacterium]MCP5001234.1 cytochrome oxidase [Hyphomicrobiales bacterium]
MRVLRPFFSGPFTGWHMLGVMGLFFGTVIGVNITMAYFAGSSWSGLIVKNTYVASQNFDEEVTETENMKAKGWVSRLDVSGDAVTYSLTNALGSTIAADAVSVAFSRPVGEDEDSVLMLQRQADGRYATVHDLADGQWQVKVTAVKDDERIYRDVQRIIVGGSGSN